MKKIWNCILSKKRINLYENISFFLLNPVLHIYYQKILIFNILVHYFAFSGAPYFAAESVLRIGEETFLIYYADRN